MSKCIKCNKEILVLNLTIPVEPVAKGRPIFSRRGFAITPLKTRNAESTIKQYTSLKFQGNLYNEPLSVDITFWIKRPKSVKREYPAVKPDVDNFVKLICDSLNGVVWVDDSLIVDLTARKRYTDKNGYYEIKIEVKK